MRKNETCSEERKKTRCRLRMKRERESGSKGKRGRESRHIDRSDLSAARQPRRRLSLCCHSLACRHLTPPLLILGWWRQTGGRAWVCMHLCHVCVKRACACLCVQLYISIWYVAAVSVCEGCPGPASSRASGVERLLPRGIN